MVEPIWIAWKSLKGGYMRYGEAHRAKGRKKTICGAKIPKFSTDQVEGLARCDRCAETRSSQHAEDRAKWNPGREEIAAAFARFKAGGGLVRILPPSAEAQPGVAVKESESGVSRRTVIEID